MLFCTPKARRKKTNENKPRTHCICKASAVRIHGGITDSDYDAVVVGFACRFFLALRRVLDSFVSLAYTHFRLIHTRACADSLLAVLNMPTLSQTHIMRTINLITKRTLSELLEFCKSSDYTRHNKNQFSKSKQMYKSEKNNNKESYSSKRY